MKVLSLKLNDKLYMTGKITTFISKEALKIQKEALSLAKTGKNIQNNETVIDEVDSLLDKLLELKERKTWLLCEVYGNKFTADEIERALSDEEIDESINSIITGICGVISKN
jgi:hypothetical protein